MAIHNFEELKSAFIGWHTKHGYDTSDWDDYDVKEYLCEWMQSGEPFSDEYGHGTVFDFEMFRNGDKCSKQERFVGYGKIYEYDNYDPDNDNPDYTIIGFDWDF